MIFVDFRYIDGIKIPDGYYYIGRNDENKIVISTNQTDTIDNTSNTQYVWQPTTETPENVNFAEGQTQLKLEQSAKYNNGYYYNSNTNTVIYLPFEITTLHPGETATAENNQYVDGDKISIIPEGFTVSDVDRGGNYGDSSARTSNREYDSTTNNGDSFSFRPILYL